MHNKKARHVRTTRRTQQEIIDQIARTTRKYRSHKQTYRHTETDTIVQPGREQIEEGSESRLAFVRNSLSRGDGVSTRPVTGDVGTGGGCGRMVDIGSVGVGTGMNQLKGCVHRLPASAASAVFVTQWIVCIFVTPVEIPRPRNPDICTGFQGKQWGCGGRCWCRCRLVLVIPMRSSRIGHIRRIARKGVLWVYRHRLLLVFKLSRSTLSNVNLTLYVYYTSSKSITLRLMP